MQDQSVSSAEKLQEAQERLSKSLARLESLIQGQEKTIETERTVRSQVIKDLDSHIENLENILSE